MSLRHRVIIQCAALSIIGCNAGPPVAHEDGEALQEAEAGKQTPSDESEDEATPDESAQDEKLGNAGTPSLNLRPAGAIVRLGQTTTVVDTGNACSTTVEPEPDGISGVASDYCASGRWAQIETTSTSVCMPRDCVSCWHNSDKMGRATRVYRCLSASAVWQALGTACSGTIVTNVNYATTPSGPPGESCGVCYGLGPLQDYVGAPNGQYCDPVQFCTDDEAPYYWPSNGRCYPCPEGQILQPDAVTGGETCQPRCAGLTGAALTACEGCSADGGVACRCNQFPPASRALCSCLAFAGGDACYPPPPKCTDKVQNQGEQGVDCGGPCPMPCSAPTCSDDSQNQNEEGVDCGGPCETPCPSATCSDSVLNQNEEGVDCGGPCGTPCFPANCSDGVQNQDETGIDCGGSCTACPGCGDGKRNQGEQDIDCGGPCATACPSPTCADGKINQGEQGIDCGGPCPTACDAPTCQDGKINQGEQGIDCGGPCVNSCPQEYVVQVRRLFVPPFTYHEDVCVHDTCYTSGPLEGNYRRDPESSAWALTDADGWSTPPGLSFKVTTELELTMLKGYMDAEVVGTVSKSNFLANFFDFWRDGFCIWFSRTNYDYMKQIIVPGECFCTASCENCANESDEGSGVSLTWPVDSESMCRPEVAQSDLEFECLDKSCYYATGTTCLFMGGF